MNALRATLFAITCLIGQTSYAASDSDSALRFHELAISAARTKLVAAAAFSGGSKDAAASVTRSGSPFANKFRAYPPSCAAWALPDTPNESGVSKRMALFTRDGNGNAVTPETVTITVWRMPCSSSGNKNLPYNTNGSGNAMTLLRVDRDLNNNGRSDRFPTFPLLNIVQGNVGVSDYASAVRAATEPNTIVADGPYDAPIFLSTTYVLENYNFPPDANNKDYKHLYNQAFKLVINPWIQDVSPTVLDIGAYTGAGLSSMPLDGYVAAQYYNSTRNEGLVVQMAEGYDADNPERRQITFDLLTTDLAGAPFWLIGSAAFENSYPTSLSVPVSYLVQGNAVKRWGSASVNLRNCNTLEVTFAPLAGHAAPVPSFSGKVTYSRIFAANGMVCE